MPNENDAPNPTPAPAPAPAAPAPVDVAALLSGLTAKLDTVMATNATLQSRLDNLAQEGLTPLKTKYPDVTADMLEHVPADKREAVAMKLQATINGHKPKTAPDELSSWANVGGITPANEDEARIHEQKRAERIAKATAEGNLDALTDERRPEYAKFLSGLLRKPGR